MEMDDCMVLTKRGICESCLNTGTDLTLTNYQIQNELLKNIIKLEQILLCDVCIVLAQNTETFIQNITLARMTLSSAYKQSVKIEIEHLNDSNIKDESEMLMKEEDDNIKSEIDDLIDAGFNDADLSNDTGMIYANEINLDNFQNKGSVKLNKYPSEKQMVEIIYLNKKQLLEVRSAMAQDPQYVNAKFQCRDCIKYFAHQDTFDQHMANHKEESGKYVCDICKQRLKTEEKFDAHNKGHYRRYKCTLCDVMKLTREVIVQHYTKTHTDLKNDCYCVLCDKWLKNSKSFRKHTWFKHSGPRKVKCEYCEKSLSDKKCLRTHIICKHPDKVNAPLPSNDFICLDCGKAFPTPGRLKRHALTHIDTKEFYCVECDKGFKTHQMLQAHLNSAIHTKYNQYRYTCEQCDKRLLTKRALESHMNSQHLKIRPYKCKECSKTFLLHQRLKNHIRIVHEGMKPEPNIPCTICNKLFRTNNTLKEHFRTHTGERPFECKICGSRFTQSNVLRTHQKTVHFKMNRKTRLCEMDSKLLKEDFIS